MTQCWPVHPQPLPDELFSSWIYRAARANGQNVFSLCYLLVPKLRNTYYSFDYVVTKHVVWKFSKVLRVSSERAWQTTLESYAGYLFDQSTPKVNRKTGILQTGLRQNHHKRFCLQFCPLCLAEGEPYFRKKWRVSFITVCTKHTCQLHDRCPECSSPIKPQSNDIGRPKKMPFPGEITQCFKCGFNLKCSAVKRANLQAVLDTYWYESVLDSGFVQLLKEQWIYSFSFFKVLRHLIRLTVTKHLRSTQAGKLIDTDTLPHDLRYQAMCELSGAFTQWPNTFISFCKKNNIPYSDLTSITKEKPLLPFWLDSEARQYLYTPNLSLTEESIKAAIDYLLAYNKTINISELNRFLGYTDSKTISNTLKCYQQEKQFQLSHMRK